MNIPSLFRVFPHFFSVSVFEFTESDGLFWFKINLFGDTGPLLSADLSSSGEIAVAFDSGDVEFVVDVNDEVVAADVPDRDVAPMPCRTLADENVCEWCCCDDLDKDVDGDFMRRAVRSHQFGAWKSKIKSKFSYFSGLLSNKLPFHQKIPGHPNVVGPTVDRFPSQCRLLRHPN